MSGAALMHFNAMLTLKTPSTVREDCLGTANNLSTAISMKKGFGQFCYSFHKVINYNNII